MKNRLIQFSISFFLLFCAVAFWCLSAHFLRGGVYYVTHTAVFFLLGAFFLAQRKPAVEPVALSHKKAKRVNELNVVLIGCSVIVLLFFPFITAASSDNGYQGLTVCVAIAGGLGAVCVGFWLVTSWTDSSRFFHGHVQLGMNVFGLILMLVFSWSLVSFRGHISVKMLYMVVTLSLLIGLFCYAFYRPARENHMGIFGAFAFGISLMLFLTMNVGLDHSAGTKLYYTVIETGGYHGSALCETDGGEAFDYFYCPFEAGERWYMYAYDGWFHEPYYIDVP